MGIEWTTTENILFGMSHNFKINLELQFKKAITVKSDFYLPK